MNEAEWLAVTDPQKMLDFLRGTASERKLRMFACGCCYRLDELWGTLEGHGLVAVESAHIYADGGATREDLKSVRDGLSDIIDDYYGGSEEIRFHALDCVTAIPLGDVNGLANRIIEFIGNAHHWTLAELDAERDAERVLQCEILREFFGNPFRPMVLNPVWLTSTVVPLAKGIYEDRAFDRLPILADALEDAGCTDAELLGHLRGPGKHVRGCWALDLITGRT
jgi:hypothetical protein